MREIRIVLALALVAALAACTGVAEHKRNAEYSESKPEPTFELPLVEPLPEPEPEPPVDVHYYIIPHQDDEFEVWGKVEFLPDVYKVFIVLTAGDQTGACANIWSMIQANEVVPDPLPTDKWTEDCDNARVASWVAFFEQMGKTDDTLPSVFMPEYQTEPLPTEGAEICRYDGTDECKSNPTARVWVDGQERGALISFDLGDGDLTPDEGRWAIQSVLDNKSTFGIPENSVDRAMYGAYANATDWRCYVYPHPDHVAIHTTLTENDFGVQTRGYATCGEGDEGTETVQVSEESMRAAFEVLSDGTRVGAHGLQYGWLHNTVYPFDPDGQGEIFHGRQVYRVLH